MRSRTVSEVLEQQAIRPEGEIEALRPATYREAAAAIFMALADSGLDEGPWSCEIELLEDDYELEEQVPTKH